MINFEEFVAKHNGNYVDWDKKFGPQCVDLIRYYQNEVLNVPLGTIPAANTAKQIFLNFPNAGNQYFTKIIAPYGSPLVPDKGDIIFWGFYPFITGLAGHVAICSNAGIWQFISFDQNYSKPNFCRYVNHNYRGVLGWLRKK